MPSIFGVPVDAAYHLVAGFTSILTPVLGGVAAVAAIIAVTVAVRIILMPLSFRALRGQAAAARLAPQLQALRKRYARRPERLQREMAALYKREGTSMFAGITPFLLQWPLLSVMYLLFRSAQVDGKPNTLLTHHLLGVPLGRHWLGGVSLVSGQGLVFLGVLALLAGLTWLSVRLGQAMTAQAVPGAATQATSVPGGALIKVLPYLTVVIAAFTPLAAGIYLLASAGWSLAERRLYLRSASRSSSTEEKAGSAPPRRGRAAGRS
jgi:YidC/Oxa1 family membrane protein insertase